MAPLIGIAEIREAAGLIAPFVRRTPLLFSAPLSELVGRPVLLKPEFWQETGSFKVRGAASFLLRRPRARIAAGVVTASAGNHGQAVAWVARQLGVPATVVVPATAPAVKQRGILRLGARLERVGAGYDAAERRARELEAEAGLTRVPAAADEDVIAGQGTVGLEIAADLPEVAEVYVPVGGGGLAAGVAAALAALAPRARVVGVQSERTPGMARALAAGTVVEVEDLPTLCDGLAGSVEPLTLEYARRYLAELRLVSEEAVARALRFLLAEERWLVEGSAAVGVAALLDGAGRGATGPAVVVLTGRNIDLRRLADLL